MKQQNREESLQDWEKNPRAQALLQAARVQDQGPIHPAVGTRLLRDLETRLSTPPPRRPRIIFELKAAIAISACLIAAYLAFGHNARPAHLKTNDRAMAYELKALGPLSTPGRMTLSAQSAIRVERTGRLHLSRGKVTLNVDPLPPGQTLQVIAGEVTVSVVGTIFSVHHRGPNDIKVQVKEGVVKVSAPKGVTFLRAGDVWPAPKETLEAAAHATRAGAINKARKIYANLSQGSGRTAALALYLGARLEAGHAHSPQAAIQMLDRLLARFPEDPLQPEILVARIEALLALGQCQKAEQARARFKEQHAQNTDLLKRIKPSAQCENFF